MEIRTKTGRVTSVTTQGDGVTLCTVRLDGREEPAIAYTHLTGPVGSGDTVTVNTTAVELKLGTGGYHFIQAVWGDNDATGVSDAASPRHGTSRPDDAAGHIMKLRYTPFQMRVLAGEEADSPFHRPVKDVPHLKGTPVLVGTVHSQVPVAVAAMKTIVPDARIVYVMTDGGALPAAFSHLIASMKRANLIDAVVTAGHAFGGDVEAVNVPSAMALAKAALEADIIVVCMGPGVVGTGTALGTTALEMAPHLTAAYRLGGRPLPIVRMSGRDRRRRHVGISHHVMTALTVMMGESVDVPLPKLHLWPPDTTDGGPITTALQQQLHRQKITLVEAGHRPMWVNTHDAYDGAKALLTSNGIHVTTMGRDDGDDPVFFHAATAAAVVATESPAVNR